MQKELFIHKKRKKPEIPKIPKKTLRRQLLIHKKRKKAKREKNAKTQKEKNMQKEQQNKKKCTFAAAISTSYLFMSKPSNNLFLFFFSDKQN